VVPVDDERICTRSQSWLACQRPSCSSSTGMRRPSSRSSINGVIDHLTDQSVGLAPHLDCDFGCSSLKTVHRQMLGGGGEIARRPSRETGDVHLEFDVGVEPAHVVLVNTVVIGRPTSSESSAANISSTCARPV
jgi:hypothetical protein